ncbi:hypothetical protein KH5_06140 [Urechidicola sp. KH5]
MLSPGQKIFAVFFVIAFTIFMIVMYRKDLKLHRIYYKNVYKVLLAIIVVIALFTIITFSLH